MVLLKGMIEPELRLGGKGTTVKPSMIYSSTTYIRTNIFTLSQLPVQDYVGLGVEPLWLALVLSTTHASVRIKGDHPEAQQVQIQQVSHQFQEHRRFGFPAYSARATGVHFNSCAGLCFQVFLQQKYLHDTYSKAYLLYLFVGPVLALLTSTIQE